MLKFDIQATVAKIKKAFGRSKQYVDSVSVNLPFGTINIKPHSRESETAKEIVIFLSDRRVLDAAECCDGCVDAALKSIQEIRAFLVEKQLGLKDHTDSVLYMLVEIMLTELRQFQTQVQILERPQRDGARILETEPNYYLALNCLRGELLALLSQIANIGRIAIGKNCMLTRYSNIILTENAGYCVTWNPELYLPGPADNKDFKVEEEELEHE